LALAFQLMPIYDAPVGLL